MTNQNKRNAQRAQSQSSLVFPSKNVKKSDLLLVLLYLVVDLIPQFGSIEVMGPQWLYLAVLNLISTIFIFISFKDTINIVLEKFSNNALSLVFLTVFILCGLSILFALNPIESLVVYVRFIITLIAFLNIGILLYQRPKSIEYLFQAVSIIALFQCLPLLYSYLQNIEIANTDTLVANLKANAGNKNVLAASFVIKAPIIIYCVFKYFSLWRYIVNITSLVLVVLMIFILNARAAYLGFFVQIALYLIFLFKYKQQTGLKQAIRHLSTILIPVIFGLVLSQILLTIPNNTHTGLTYTTLDKRLATLSDHNESSSSARLFFWGNALKQIKETPITGCGYGNWKIESIKYEYGFYNDFNYSKHVHNDFLQITAESGIITGLLYISIFLIALIYTVKSWNSDVNSDIKILSVISLMSLAGYFVDATFNFPAERPVMQIFLALVLAINVVMYISTRKSQEKKQVSSNFKVLILCASCILTLISIFTTWLTYKSMMVQTLTHFNFGTIQPGVNWQDVNPKFPAIPNLAENNIPINDTKAWYLFRAQRFDDALSLLNQDINANPYSMSKEWLKASIYTAQNRIDSAHFYSKKGFFKRPRNLSLYNIVTRTSVPLKDTVTIQKAFDKYLQYRNEPHAWKIYIRSLFAVNYNREELLHVSDSIAKIYPDNSEIQHTRFFVWAGNAAMKKNFPEALVNQLSIMKLYPNDYENIENIGLTYYYMKDYIHAAIYFRKVSASRVYLNGKSEFYLGNCLLHTNNKNEACSFLYTASNRNYPGAAILFNKNNCQLDSQTGT